MKTLHTERLTLRETTMHDLEAAYQAMVVEQDDEPISMDEVRNEVAFDVSLAQQPVGQYLGRLAIVLKSDDKLIGYCVLMPRLCTVEEQTLFSSGEPSRPYSSLEAEIGWALSNRHRGRGYATEAAMAFLKYGFEELRLPRIIAFTEAHNLPSIRVMERLGIRIINSPNSSAVVGVIEHRDFKPGA